MKAKIILAVTLMIVFLVLFSAVSASEPTISRRDFQSAYPIDDAYPVEDIEDDTIYPDGCFDDNDDREIDCSPESNNHPEISNEQTQRVGIKLAVRLIRAFFEQHPLIWWR
jgi:hypothetical protein